MRLTGPNLAGEVDEHRFEGPPTLWMRSGVRRHRIDAEPRCPNLLSICFTNPEDSNPSTMSATAAGVRFAALARSDLDASFRRCMASRTKRPVDATAYADRIVIKQHRL